MKMVYFLKGLHVDYRGPAVAETDKAYLFRIPKLTPCEGKISYRDIQISKRIMWEYDRKEDKDSGEVVIWVGLPDFVR